MTDEEIRRQVHINGKNFCMIKLTSLIYESKILVPRRTPEERERRWIQEIYRKIQDYIKNGSEGDLNLSGTPIKILPNNLKKVVGSLDLMESKIEDLNSLEYVYKDLDVRYTPIKRLPNNLKKIEGCLWSDNSHIEDLNNLEYVGRLIDLKKTPIKKLPDHLKRAEYDLWLEFSEIEDLNNLEYVGGILDLRYTPLSKTTTVKKILSKIHVTAGVLL